MHEEHLLFLETTVQIDRIIGTQDKRNAIRSNIRNRTLCTSGHVLGEFNRTLVRDAVTFRDLLLTSPNVEEAVKRLPSYGRKYPRTVDLLATLGLDNDKQNTLDRLEKFIEWQAYDHFWEFIDQSCYTDEVKCVLRSWQPELKDDATYDVDGLKCLKSSPPNCGVQDFIEHHRVALGNLVESAKASKRPNVTKAAQAFEGILDGSDVPFGERSNCYPISDTLIVLEAPNEAEVYSTDGDIGEICEILRHPIFSHAPAES